MNKVIKIIGALVLTILCMSIPIIFGISIAANWNTYISLFLGLVTLGEITVVYMWFYYSAEEE